MQMAKVGLLIEEKAARRRWEFGMNAFSFYAQEILEHAGIPYEKIEGLEELEHRSFDILIVALASETEDSVSVLWEYAERGGRVIGYGCLNAVAGKLGYAQTGGLGNGYASLPDMRGSDVPLRFLDANPWYAKETAAFAAEEYGTIALGRPGGPDAGPLVQRFVVGAGSIDRWSVDVLGTIVHMQQGIGPVLEDGVPALDGTANVDEFILKADDRIGMNWELDRLTTEKGTAYFAYPYADLWREALLGHLLRTVLERGLTLPFKGYWPDGIPYVAAISHDSDHNEDKHAAATLQLLDECDIRTTWCMLEPGYSKEIYEQVSAKGHELAFHYNALDMQGGKWDENEFARQLDWLKEAAGLTTVTSNKNHYTRCEGWGELFRWLEKYGISSDQTRGPSKKGNIGFLFGTCHPYFPIAWFDEKNRIYDVLEVGFLTQDLDVGYMADSIVPFLHTVARVEGVAHFLFHQIHIYSSEQVRDAVRNVVAQAKRLGYRFWTGKQIDEWTRRRRMVRITGMELGGAPVLDHAEQAPGLVVWVPVSESAAQEGTYAIEKKFGVSCRKIVC